MNGDKKEEVPQRERQPEEFTPPSERDLAFDCLLGDIRADADAADITDMDAMVAWKMGLAAFQRGRKFGLQFPHDPASEESSRPEIGRASCRERV